MNLGELFRTKRWKTFMGYIYGWGASVVMIGALFKLEHWQYSGLLLTIGLITEAIIFFLSAFEPPLEIPEWSKVYPELREDYELIDLQETNQKNRKGFDELFSSSELTPELLDKVGKGLNQLSNTARGLSDISTATLATDMYVKNLGSASESMGTLTEINNRANESINNSVNSLVESYSSTARNISESGKVTIDKLNRSSEEIAQKITESGRKIADAYNNASDSLSGELNSAGAGTKEYNSNLAKLNGNITTLNKNFEEQLRDSENQFKASQQFSNDLNQMNEILAASVDQLKKYKENAELLNKNLEALNTIYGNMLGAMSYRK